jgi:hypothetical protein
MRLAWQSRVLSHYLTRRFAAASEKVAVHVSKALVIIVADLADQDGEDCSQVAAF